MPGGQTQLTIPRTFGDEKYTDLAVRCGDAEWRVHRMVVCGQSSFSAKACDGGYEVSRTAQLRIPPADHRLNIVQEAEAGVGTLQKIEPSVAKAMLRYMCEGNYTDAGHVELPPIMFDVHIHTAADFYDVRSTTGTVQHNEKPVVECDLRQMYF